MNICTAIIHDDQTRLAFGCQPCRLSGVDSMAEYRTPDSWEPGTGYMLCRTCCEREFGALPETATQRTIKDFAEAAAGDGRAPDDDWATW